MWTFIIQFMLGYCYGLFFEWWIHKNILHKYGKKMNDSFGFHYKIHHRNSRRNSFYDENYNLSLVQKYKTGGCKEDLYLLLLAIIHVPTVFIFPGFFIAVLFSTFEYYFVHKKSHIDPEWAKKFVPWHYEHHMGKNQDMNWGIRTDFFDKLFGTSTNYKNEQIN